VVGIVLPNPSYPAAFTEAGFEAIKALLQRMLEKEGHRVIVWVRSGVWHDREAGWLRFLVV
jgi:hypothetical protein